MPKRVYFFETDRDLIYAVHEQLQKGFTGKSIFTNIVANKTFPFSFESMRARFEREILHKIHIYNIDRNILKTIVEHPRYRKIILAHTLNIKPSDPSRPKVHSNAVQTLARTMESGVQTSDSGEEFEFLTPFDACMSCSQGFDDQDLVVDGMDKIDRRLVSLLMAAKRVKIQEEED